MGVLELEVVEDHAGPAGVGIPAPVLIDSEPGLVELDRSHIGLSRQRVDVYPQFSCVQRQLAPDSRSLADDRRSGRQRLTHAGNSQCLCGDRGGGPCEFHALVQQAVADDRRIVGLRPHRVAVGCVAGIQSTSSHNFVSEEMEVGLECLFHLHTLKPHLHRQSPPCNVVRALRRAAGVFAAFRVSLPVEQGHDVGAVRLRGQHHEGALGICDSPCREGRRSLVDLHALEHEGVDHERQGVAVGLDGREHEGVGRLRLTLLHCALPH